MTQTELILEYIDGGLDSDAEQSLFDAMARHPELRSALRQFIVIGDAVRADREAYTPPAHVERALMAGLGIGTPLAPAATVAGGMGLLGRLSALGGRFLSVIVAFLLGALLAGGTVLMMNGDDDAGVIAGGSAGNRTAQRGTVADAGRNAESRGPGAGDLPQMGENAENRSSASSSSSGSVSEGGAGTSPVRNGADVPALRSRTSSAAERTITSSNALRARSRQSRASNRSGADGSLLERMGGNDGGNNAGGNNGGSVTESAGMNDGRSTQHSASGAMNSVPDVQPVAPRTESSLREDMSGASTELAPESLPEDFPAPVEFKFEDAEQRDPVIGAELRHNFFSGPFNPNKARRNTPGLDNWMGGVMINPRDVFSLGAEVGQESFDQTLHYSDDDTLQVEQRPSFMWGGVSGRLRMGQLPFAGADAFVQGTLAYSTGGPVMRMRIGGEVPLGSSLGFTAGLETSALVYTFRDQLSITGRWGITTGVMWNF